MKITKTTVTAKPRQLSAKWTIDLQQGKAEFSKDIEDELAKILQAEIDREVLTNMLEMAGWVKVGLDRYSDRKHSVDIANWVEENCKGNHMHSGKCWLFESKEDAAWFTLRWS